MKIGKLKRKKIRVSRENLLDNAAVIFDAFGDSKSLLEFEYINEEGTGLGPTLEYYTLVIQEILNKREKLWRKTDDNTLFPIAMIPKIQNQKLSTPKKGISDGFSVVGTFKLLGTIVARAVLDQRVIDLPLSKTFWDLILDRGIGMEDMVLLDKGLYKTMHEMQKIVNKLKELQSNPDIPSRQRQKKLNSLTFKGC